MTNLFSPKVLSQLDDGFVERQLRERRDAIFGALGDRTLEPNKEIVKELAEINIALGDFCPEDEAFQ